MWNRDSSITDPTSITIPNQRKVKANTSPPNAWLSVWLSNAPAQTPPVSTVVAAITRAPFLTAVDLRLLPAGATRQIGNRTIES